MDFLSIFEEVDIADISCKDKIQMIAGELKEEDDEYMELLVGLKDKMIVTWEQPWYQKSGWLTRKIEPDENKEKFRIDKFTLTECEKVHRNWLKFVKKFQIPNKPVSLARWRNIGKSKRKEYRPEEYVRHYIISYLARGVQRNLHQIFQHFNACYGTIRKGPYTKLERKVIKICYYHFPRDAVKLASQILGREARGIQTKIHENLKDSPEKKRHKVKLNLASATKLLKLILKHTELPLEQLKYKKIDRSTWVKLEDDMNKDAKALYSLWYNYLHVQIFVKCEVKMKKLIIRLLKVIRKYPYRIWTDINWKELVPHFPDGVTSQFLYNVAVHSAGQYKNYLKSPLDDVLDYIRIKNKNSTNRRLKTLTLNNDGMLEEIYYKN